MQERLGQKPEGPQLRLASSGPKGDGLGLDDKARFSSVVMPHLGAAYSLAQWLTGNRADAEDVVQEECLRAFKAISGFAGGNARAWVLTIVRHTAYSWLGSNRQKPLVAVDDLEAVELAQADPGDLNAETPETTVIALSDAEQLRAAIAALPTPSLPFRGERLKASATVTMRSKRRKQHFFITAKSDSCCAPKKRRWPTAPRCPRSSIT